MKTTVKYVVLKSREYQLGTPLFEESIEADANYFDQIPNIIRYQNHDFKVKSKELTRKQIFDDFEELFNLPDQENVLNLILKNSEKLSHPASKLQEYTYIRSKFNRNAKDQKYFLSLEEKYPNLKVIKMGSVVKLGIVS